MPRYLLSCALFSLLVTGCGGGGSDTDDKASLAPVSCPEGSGSSVLTGNPTPAVAGLPYHYEPELIDAASTEFCTEDLPSWASLDTTTGIISGTPDSDDVTASRPFTLTVTTDAGDISAQELILKVLPTETYLAEPAIAFDAFDYNGNDRALRNDLSTGQLQGQVTFAQSHTVKPNHNFVRNKQDETLSIYKPKLVALRDALLMFIPDTDETPITVEVEAFMNGEPVGRYAMKHPNALPESDFSGRRRVEYSTRAWSVKLPWDLIRNGLSLAFTVNADAPDSQTGQLAASDIDMGEASQLVLQSLRLGMLTPIERNANHFTLNDPVMAATDYFQTLPVSKLVMGSYADMELDKVIIGSGKIYTDVSDGEGGIYSGDMRGDVAKSQVSVGINEADYGVTSNSMRQSYPHVFKQITNHHAWGNYQNGRQWHGLSGGNGIGTLAASSGNEASHEWGHAYGLGHYPGSKLTEDGRWQRHHADSGWGHIAYRNRMRDNIHHNSWTDEAKPFGTHFMGHIEYRKDAMSGGWGSSPFSSYTLYTSFSARMIQQDLARFPIPDETYETGYKKWDTQSGEYKAHHFQASQAVLAPVKTGVPVATILGGYDPDGTNAVIYPVFHGNYGNVFDLPEPDMSAGTDVCWVDVQNAHGQQKRIEVAAQRHNNGTINQLHFNLEATFRPTEATLICRRDGKNVQLTQTTFDGKIPELPSVAIVGQEHGYEQLREREIGQLNKALEAIAADEVPVLSNDANVWLASYSSSDLAKGLSETAKAVLVDIQKSRNSAVIAQALINKQESEGATATDIQSSLTDLLIDRGLITKPADIELEGEVIHIDDIQLSTSLDANGFISVVNAAEAESEPAQWLMTDRGSLHPVDQPWNCLAPDGAYVALEACDIANSNQRWLYRDNQTLKNLGSGKCMDYAGYDKAKLMWTCHGKWNQQWQGIHQTNNHILSMLSSKVVKALYGY